MNIIRISCVACRSISCALSAQAAPQRPIFHTAPQRPIIYTQLKPEVETAREKVWFPGIS